jgi:cytochrome c553
MKKATFLTLGFLATLTLSQSVVAGDVGEAKAQGCAGCHNAANNSLAGKGEAHLVTQMKAMRAGERAHPPALSDMSDQDINDVAAFMNGAQ